MSKLDEIVGESAARVDEEIRERPGKKSATSIRQEIPQIHVSFEEQRTLQAGLASLAVTDSASGIRRMPALGQLLESALCAEKIRRLRNFPQSREVAMIVRGLPLDPQLPATPYDMKPGIENLSILAGAILSVLQTLQTHPVAYEGENDDTVFRHVSPKHKRETEKSSYGSRMDLGMHVDNPHLPLTCEPVSQLSACPEYLSLTGLRCELGVPTRIVAIGDVLAMLPASVEEELSQPHFAIRRPASFGKQGNVLENVPLLYRCATGSLYCRYNKASVAATCANAQFALQLFAAAANHPDVVHHILLQPGDMLIFKNQKTLHARDGFTPRYDGHDRWMLRVFGVNDPARVVPLAPDQPFIVRA
ncbi:TauD/TfdA family dioxygenase [Pseudomonas brassicacearum]|uniref:Taurine catabolism dioxygenase TauD n=1 Tax=Pseudomonas brassicacearum TaxID=930166 RepID=A0A423GNE6_9PSED|nr:TauD/TfdA family dioxygenase [Pseudomonas brassicacearum]ROM93860.1 taurine catabolism dioxygenase TauD [Pseudomonas brassicacearum]